MLNRNTRSVFTGLLMMFFVSVLSWSQHTFRGGINGVVTDQSGAVVPGALVQITNTATNVTLTTTSTSAGEYAFPELSLGKYDIVVSASGFKTEKVVGVTVSAGQIFTQAVKLSVSSSAETVEVDADAYTLDTTTTTQTTIIDSEAVDNAPRDELGAGVEAVDRSERHVAVQPQRSAAVSRRVPEETASAAHHRVV